MRISKSRRARGYLSRGTLFSLLLHTHLLVPLLIAAWVYGGRQEAQRPEEIDVAFEDVAPEELPASLPPLDQLPDTNKKLKPKVRPLAPLPKDKGKKTASKQDQEVVVPELPPMPQPPPPPPPDRRAHEKMVDLDNDKNVEPPPDAKFLAQKNNRALEETRAKDTNLEKASKGEEPDSTPSERTDTEVGGEKEKIAQVEEQKSKEGKRAPDVTPHADPQLSEAAHPPRDSLLALRDPAPRTHELTPETADPSLPRTPDGEVAVPERNVRGQQSDAAKGKGKRIKLALSGKDYEYLFGAEAEAERRLAQKTRSTKVGKFAARQARIRAALENFIPEVKPGNQTALNTRAAPFAAYIARMHRSIHQLWGFGQLEDWDEKPSANPFNDPNLMTTLEIVLNGDGTVDNVMIVRSSGYLAYDVAAVDVAYSAGPYPDPPREIRSANGKIYLHWKFHRDGRQCATSGVDPYILDNPPAGSDKPAIAELPGAGGKAPPRPIGAATGAGEGEGGPRRLQRNEPTSTRPVRASGGGGREGEAGVAAPAEKQAAPAAQPVPPGAIPRANDPAARALADRWFAALASGDAAAMAEIASYPFKTSAGVDVKNRAELVSMLQDLIAEGHHARPSALALYTGAGARGALGRLPPGFDGTGSLFAVAAVGGHDSLILVMTQRNGTWKAVGFVRR